MHEGLFGDDEDHRPSAHPLISCVGSDPVSPAELGIVTPSRHVHGRLIDLRTSDRSIAAS
jgi:hypothetical protein